MKTTKNNVIVNFVLDKSGSMAIVKDATISGVNEYIETLKNDKKSSYKLALTLFDTVVTKGKEMAIEDHPLLSKETYQPDGMTALYDAVCQSVKELKANVKKTQKVLTVVMTDGGENSSREYSQAQLKALVEECEKEGNWTFVFLGANQDSWATAQQFGFSKQNVSNYNASAVGTRSAINMMASNTVAYASMSASNSKSFFSKEDQDKLEKSV